MTNSKYTAPVVSCNVLYIGNSRWPISGLLSNFFLFHILVYIFYRYHVDRPVNRPIENSDLKFS